MPKKKKNNEWYKADLTPNRDLDALDYELALIARTIRGINLNAIRFPRWLRDELIREYINCRRLTDTLTPEERSNVVGFLSTEAQEKSLLKILRDEISAKITRQ